MWVWSCCFFLLGNAFLALGKFLWDGWSTFARAESPEELERVARLFADQRVCLESGIYDETRLSELVRKIPEPWASASDELLSLLREAGAAMSPALARLEACALSLARARREAIAVTAPARAQAWVMGAIVPLVGLFFWQVFYSLQQQWVLWAACVFVCSLVNLVAAFWVRRIADGAEAGGLSECFRQWPLWARLSAEKTAALCRAGLPPDLAWLRSVESLSRHQPQLAEGWGSTLWAEVPSDRRVKGQAERALLEWGQALRRILHLGLMEGQGVTGRLETSIQAFESDWRARVQREVALSSTRSLIPLFLGVAPSVLLLLALALGLEWQAAVVES